MYILRYGRLDWQISQAVNLNPGFKSTSLQTPTGNILYGSPYIPAVKETKTKQLSFFIVHCFLFACNDLLC